MTGKNVVYISLELSQNLIAERFDAMVSGRGTKAIYKDIDDTAFEIAKTGKNSGKIFVKRMKEGTNTNDIRAYLKEFKIKMGFEPEALMLDYLDLLHPNNKRIDVSNLFIKDKYTSEEFRGLLEEGQYLSATACQLNRDSFGVEGQFTQAHLAGGISKMNTADNAFGIYVTNEMKEAGKYKTVVLKARTSSCVNEIIEYSYNNRTMRIIDPIIDMDKPTPRNEIKNDMKTTGTIITKEEIPKDVNSLLQRMHKLDENKNTKP
jgi:replicative DNA helicase